MKKTLLLAALLLTGLSVNAQETLSTTGGDAESNTCSVSYTVGQMAVKTAYERVTNGERMSANVREGVQQTYSVEELKIEGAEPFGFNIKVYPNPTTDNVTVSLDKAVEGMHYELYDVDGRLLQKETMRTAEHSIDMRDYPSGAYLLRIISDKATQPYRIVKAK
jgi:hypothetical protein